MSTSESTGDSSSESPGEESEKEKSLGESASESSGDSTSESSGDASEKENSPLDLPGKSLGDQLNKYSGRMIKCDESSTKMYGFYDQEPDGDGEQVKAMLFGCVQKYVKGSLLWQLFPGCYVQIKDITGDGIVLVVLVEKLNHAKGKKLLVWFDERPKIVPMSDVISPCGRQAVELDVVSQKFNSKQTQASQCGKCTATGLPLQGDCRRSKANQERAAGISNHRQRPSDGGEDLDKGYLSHCHRHHHRHHHTKNPDPTCSQTKWAALEMVTLQKKCLYSGLSCRASRKFTARKKKGGHRHRI